MAVEVQAKTLFPVLPPVEANDYYEAVMDTARREYNEKYNGYSEKPAVIEGLTATWNQRNAKLISGEIVRPKPEEEVACRTFETNLNTELYDKVDLYLSFQKIRNDCARILKLYDAAIEKCVPPTLDISTLNILQKLKVKVSDIGTAYDKTFVTDLEQLKDQRTKIDDLYKSIVPKLFELKKAGEILAKYRANERGVTGFIASWTNGWTPYFSKAIAARTQELGLVEAPKPEAADKKSQ